MSLRLRALILEDQPDDADLLVATLRVADYDVEWTRVDSEPDFVEGLKTDPDVVLADFRLPGFDALHALDILQKSGRDIPFILVSGTIGEELAVSVIHRGASDYVMKDRLTRLGAAVEQALDKKRLRLETEQMSRELRQNEERYRLLFEGGPLPMWIYDLETLRYIEVNQAALQQYGYSREEFLSMTVMDVVPAEDAPAFLELQANLPQRNIGTWRHLKKDGTIIDVEIIANTITIGDKQVRFGLSHDVTARKLAEEEKKKLEEQFLRAQRLESIGTLASGVAHDLNNILAPILMSASMLREKLPPDLQENIITTIEESAQRGSEIIKQVLTFAKGAQGDHLPLQPRHLLRQVEKIMRETFPKSITIEHKSNPSLWTVDGDPTQLHQVLLNLCINARDAMPMGGELVLSASNETVDENLAAMFHNAKPGPYVVLNVADSGSGIPPEIVDKIFDPFFTTKEPGKGTGLGLATVIGIVKGHGGFVHLQTEVGKGTTFKIYLPATNKPEALAQAGQVAETPHGNGELILAVDDEMEIRMMLERILSRNGYKPLLASDGNEALKKFAMQAGSVRLVLTDVMMPWVDGVVLTRALRKMDPHVKVIASTGQPELSRLQELKALGVNALLKKPYNRDKLLQKVNAVLQGRSFENDFTQ